MEIGGRFVVLFVADKVGRRPFAIFLTWTVTVCCGVAAALVAMGKNQQIIGNIVKS